MNDSFFFYDLETSGVNARSARIMQFAGQRTDMNLNPIGEPENILIKLSEDVLPEPEAILITGITPQKTLVEGITEADFYKYFYKEIVQPGTIFAGFNSVRFDDEFMRFGMFRNFYDPYEWQWKDNSSRWDILDLVRITRALRPEGIKWPFGSDGKASNRLELLTSLNKLEHTDAHDALSDVRATINVAKLIKEKQPKLFSYLLSLRTKKSVENFIKQNEMFVYVSGRYDSKYEKLAVVASVGLNKEGSSAFVFDLRYDPSLFLNMSPEDLADALRYKKDSEQSILIPVKQLQFNKCPAVAPLGVLNDADQERLNIDIKSSKKYLQILRSSNEFYNNLLKAYEILNNDYKQTALIANVNNAEAELYDSFIPNEDRSLYNDIHSSNPSEIMRFKDLLKDDRLKAILPLYKARNFPKSLSDEEASGWENYKNSKINQELGPFVQKVSSLQQREGLTQNQKYILEELLLYAQSIAPFEV